MSIFAERLAVYQCSLVILYSFKAIIFIINLAAVPEIFKVLNIGNLEAIFIFQLNDSLVIQFRSIYMCGIMWKGPLIISFLKRKVTSGVHV
jgi:hypothetical protein